MTAALVAGATVLSYLVGWLMRWPVLLPVLNALAAYPFMLAALRQGRPRRAIGLMLVWAGAMGATATLFSYAQTAEAGRLFINGEAYRREMFVWLRTGEGTESDPARFVPQHLLHVGIFGGLSLASGSVLSMPLGAVLMNYMGYYVGALAAASIAPGMTMLLAWHPWSLFRVVSFVVIGVLLAGPVLKRTTGFEYRLRDHAPLLGLAALGLVIDVGLKWALAPAWRRLLAQTVGW